MELGVAVVTKRGLQSWLLLSDIGVQWLLEVQFSGGCWKMALVGDFASSPVYLRLVNKEMNKDQYV